MTRSVLVLACTASMIPAFAQHVGVINPSRGMTAPPGAYQYGNILFPGGIVNQSHAARLGATVAGAPYGGVQPGYSNNGRNRTVVVPYAYPVLYPDYGYAQQQNPNVTVVVPQQPVPTVVINQNFGPDQQSIKTTVTESQEKSGLRVWEGANSGEASPKTAEKAETRAPNPGADNKPNIFLIALKDSTLRSAIGYWVEDGTLHYVTPQSSVNHVTLDIVDRELSEQLNRERNLEFDLHNAVRARREVR